MRNIFRALALALALLMTFFALAAVEPPKGEVLCDGEFAMTDEWEVEYGLDYSSPEEVALYLHAFCELPPNYLTKREARDLGWDSREGNLWDVAYGMSIGGDEFGNREGLLPDARGRTWYECDVNYFGGFRGRERLLFSDDGLICYSGDHYNTYTLLYDHWYEDEEDLERAG